MLEEVAAVLIALAVRPLRATVVERQVMALLGLVAAVASALHRVAAAVAQGGLVLVVVRMMVVTVELVGPTPLLVLP